MFHKSTIFYALFLTVCLAVLLFFIRIHAKSHLIKSSGPSNSMEVLDWSPTALEIDDQPEDIDELVSIDIIPPPYAIKVRIIVEVNDKGEPARSAEEISKDLDVASQFFSRAGMVFVVLEQSEVTIDSDIPSLRDYRNDAMMSNDHMSIYYIFGHKWLTPAGLSAFPWDDDRYGIIINGKHAGFFSLAPEIGHYFGLFHTFDEGRAEGDHVRDTFNEDEWDAEEKGPYLLYNNLMNYTGGDTRTLTAGQIERVKFFLIMLRSDHIIRLDTPGQFDTDKPVKDAETSNPVLPMTQE